MRKLSRISKDITKSAHIFYDLAKLELVYTVLLGLKWGISNELTPPLEFKH